MHPSGASHYLERSISVGSPRLSHNSLSTLLTQHPTSNDGQDPLQEVRQGAQEGRRQEEDQQEDRVVLVVHLQGAEAGPPRHRYLQARHVHHELIHQRRVRARGRRVRQAHPLQQEGDPILPRGPDGRASHASRRARQARRFRGHQGRHQVHLVLISKRGRREVCTRVHGI